MQSHAFNLDSTRVWTLNSEVVTLQQLSWMPGRELYQLDFGDHHCSSKQNCYVRSSRIPKPLPARILAQLELVIQPFVAYLHWGRIPHQFLSFEATKVAPFQWKAGVESRLMAKKWRLTLVKDVKDVKASRRSRSAKVWCQLRNLQLVVSYHMYTLFCAVSWLQLNEVAGTITHGLWLHDQGGSGGDRDWVKCWCIIPTYPQDVSFRVFGTNGHQVWFWDNILLIVLISLTDFDHRCPRWLWPKKRRDHPRSRWRAQRSQCWAMGKYGRRWEICGWPSGVSKRGSSIDPQ